MSIKIIKLLLTNNFIVCTITAIKKNWKRVFLRTFSKLLKLKKKIFLTKNAEQMRSKSKKMRNKNHIFLLVNVKICRSSRTEKLCSNLSDDNKKKKKTIYMRTWSSEHIHALPSPVHFDHQIAQEVLPGRYFRSVWSLRWERYDRHVCTVHDVNDIYARIWFSPTFASLSHRQSRTMCPWLSYRALRLPPSLTAAQRGKRPVEEGIAVESPSSRRVEKLKNRSLIYIVFLFLRG